MTWCCESLGGVLTIVLADNDPQICCYITDLPGDKLIHKLITKQKNPNSNPSVEKYTTVLPALGCSVHCQ